MHVDNITPQSARSPSGRELVSLDHDFTVIPLVARSGAKLEWALRSSAVSNVIALLDECC